MFNYGIYCMAGTLALIDTLDPHKVVLPIIALVGLVAVVAQYRDQSKWFVVGYLLLVVATLATNLENLFLGTVLNYSEHYLGLTGSGLAFLAAAYIRRQQVLSEDVAGEPDREAVADGSGVDR